MTDRERLAVSGATTIALAFAPADPHAASALVPNRLPVSEDAFVFVNQYVGAVASGAAQVDPFSVTHMGVGLDTTDRDGQTARWWTDYIVDSAAFFEYGRGRGLPVRRGSTRIERTGDSLVATTELAGNPLLRTVVRPDDRRTETLAGVACYVTACDGMYRSGRYPYSAQAHPLRDRVLVEWLDQGHRSYSLRPSSPVRPTFAYYAPAMAFEFPGREQLRSFEAGPS